MELTARDFSMIGQFAKGAMTVVPPIPIAGQAYRDPNVSKPEIEIGQPYNLIGASAFWNHVLYLATGIAKMSETFGFIPWSPLSNYIGDASWCLGLDGTPYHCIKSNGPGDDLNPGVGAKPPPNSEFWETLAEYIKRVWDGGGDDGDDGSGASAGGIVYPGAFYDFFEQSPPTGWMVRNGALLANADTRFPELWEELQKPANAWKLRTEEQWQNQSAATPWNGVGGSPHFVLNATLRTIRLPDTRGMYKEDAGFNSFTVGGVHGDAIRNFPGVFTSSYQHLLQNSGAANPDVTSGPFSSTALGYQDNAGGNQRDMQIRVTMDPSKSVPTSVANMPRAFGVLGCVYVGVTGS